MTERTFTVARGEHVGAVEPEGGFDPHVAMTWPTFVASVTTFDVRDEKDGPYVCRPMGGTGRRSDTNAAPWPLLPLDLDELHAEDVQAVHEWCEHAGLSLVLATTFSHTPDAPRMRLWVQCSRDVLATEHAFLQRSFAAIFPFKLDAATAKPSQPLFLPACPRARRAHAYAREYPGKLLDVERMLAGYQELLQSRARERAAGAKGIKTGVRTAGGTLDLFNRNFDLRDLLESSGAYVRKSRNRYMYKGSRSMRAAVVVYAGTDEQSLVSFHDTDPLAVKNDDGTPRMLDPFAAYAILEHQDDFRRAFEGARRWVNERGLGDTAAQATPPPKALTILTLDDISANLMPRDSVIQGLLERGCITLATGESNSGKTTVLQYQAMCIALGIPFAAHATTRSTTLWVAGEDAYNAQIRYLALAQKYNVPHKELKNWLFILPQRIEILNPQSLSLLHEAITNTLPNPERIGAIYLDSKSMVWGGEDENSNDEAARFIQVLNEDVAQRYNAAVVVTHHLTKFKEKSQQSARGAGALINNIDHEWRFDKRGNDRIVTMEPGAKLRIAPWLPKNFFVEVYALDTTDHPHLIDNFGEGPKTSVPTLVNATGVAVASLEEDQEQAVILDVLVSGNVYTQQGKLVVSKLARRVLVHPDAECVRQQRNVAPRAEVESAEEAEELWVKAYQDKLRRTLLPRLVEQGLLTKAQRVTSAGEKFIGDTLGPARAAPEATHAAPKKLAAPEEDEEESAEA